MREQLNSNPLLQLALVGVLLLGAVFFFMSSGGGSEEESAGSTEATTEATTEAATGSVSAGPATIDPTTATARPLPRPVLDAWRANRPLVLLFVRDGGIDDRVVKNATTAVAGLHEAAVFVVPAAKISRYAAITEGVGVDRVPALVVVRPKHLGKTVPTASVSYGFQSQQSVAQAVIDAGYKGKTLDYHP